MFSARLPRAIRAASSKRLCQSQSARKWGVTAMKIFAQERLNGKASVEKLISYALSLPVAACTLGMPELAHIDQNIQVAKAFKPLSRGEMDSMSYQSLPLSIHRSLLLESHRRPTIARHEGCRYHNLAPPFFLFLLEQLKMLAAQECQTSGRQDAGPLPARDARRGCGFRCGFRSRGHFREQLLCEYKFCFNVAGRRGVNVPAPAWLSALRLGPIAGSVSR